MEAENPMHYHEMFKTLWKRLSDFPHLMHVQKSLALIYFLLKMSSERFVADVRLRSDIIKKLCYYKYFQDGLEIGEEVRIKAQVIFMLLDDLVLLTKEREDAFMVQSKIVGCSQWNSQWNTSGSIKVDSLRQVDSLRKVDKYRSMSMDSPQGVRMSSFSEEKERDSTAMAVVKMMDMENDDDDDFFMFEEMMAAEPKPAMKQIEMKEVIQELQVRQSNQVTQKKVFLGDEQMPVDLWGFEDFADLHSTQSRTDREREEFLEFQEYKKQGLKLKDMEPIYKMEFDPNMHIPLYQGQSSAMVPYMQAQMMTYGQPVYGHAMVPYVPVYVHYGQEQQLHWN